jgi:hypothetical protein
VSVQELQLERDSMALHVLAGVPEAGKKTITDILKTEPTLWPAYGAWFSINEPTIWQEIALMAAQHHQTVKRDFLPLAESILETSDMAALKSFLEAVGLKRAFEAAGVKQAVEAVGVKQAVEAVGVKQAVEAVGVEQTLAAIGEEEFVAKLTPERRERLRQLLQQDNPSPSKPEK